MLILSRYVDESIHIGDNVKLPVLENNGSQVQIGIGGPRSVAVHRSEIYLRIQAQSVSQIMDEINGNR